MKLNTALLATSALVLTSGLAHAQSMTLVSWGGAYQASQTKAYSEPYTAANPDITIIWDESSAEAVAKLRAMNEAGNITWDLVDVEGADSIRLCDEGLAMEIDHDEMLAAAPDGTPAADDFGDSIGPAGVFAGESRSAPEISDCCCNFLTVRGDDDLPCPARPGPLPHVLDHGATVDGQQWLAG